MTAIISSAGLGLHNSSAAFLGQQGLFGQASLGQKPESSFVNIANGNLILQGQDDFIAARGVNLALARTYNAQGQLNDGSGGNVGKRWRLSSMRQVQLQSGTVNTAGSKVVRTGGDGSTSLFTYDVARQAYFSHDGAGAEQSLIYQDGRWTWRAEHGSLPGQYEVYQGANPQSLANLVEVGDRNGKRLGYVWQGTQLQSITNASGDITRFTYHASGDLVSIATEDANKAKLARVSYGYDASRRLASVTTDLTPTNASDAQIYVTRYEYEGNSDLISKVSQDDGTQINVRYDGQGRVKEIWDALGQKTQFDYSVAGQTRVVDARNQTSIYRYDTKGQLTSYQGPNIGNLRQEWQFTYDAQGNVLTQTDARGASTVYRYDGAGNRIYERQADGSTRTWVYDSNNRLLSSTHYAGIDPDGDGAQTASAPSYTRYVYDSANLLRFIVGQQGEVQAFRYNTLGEKIADIAYTQNQINLSGLSEAELANDALLQRLNTWQAAQPANKVTLTEYRYNVHGLLEAQTVYGQLDANGNGISTSQSVTQFTYTPDGLLAQKIDGNGNQTSYVYDGLGRLIQSTDARLSGETAQHSVNYTWSVDSNATDAIAYRLQVEHKWGTQSLQVQTTAYDSAGGILQTSLGRTQQNLSYTTGHLLRYSDNAFGQRQYFLYNAAAQKIAEVAPDGSLTAYFYNANGQLSRSTAHAKKVDLQKLSTLADSFDDSSFLQSLIVATPDQDRDTWQTWDKAQRLLDSVDALGFVTHREYDGAGRLIRSTRYAKPVTASELSRLRSLSAPDSINLPTPATVGEEPDRSERYFYDASGRMSGKLDARGYLTRYFYNGAGQLFHTQRHANPSPNVSAADLASLTPTDNAKDIHSYQLYDNAGRLAGEVDGENYLTEITYDAVGNVASKTRYANALRNLSLLPWAALPLSELKKPDYFAASVEDQRTSYRYDALNRLQEEITNEDDSSSRSITRYQYDRLGRQEQILRGYASQEERGSMQRFDAEGNVIGELSAEGVAVLRARATPPNATEWDKLWQEYGVTYQTNAIGQRTSMRDQRGNLTFYYYDEAGRQSMRINAMGEVTQIRYNSFGQQSEVESYAQRIAAADLASLQADAKLATRLLTDGVANASVLQMLAPLAKTENIKQAYQYEQRGLLKQEIDGAGYQTSHSYNAFGQETQTLRQLNLSSSRMVEQAWYQYDAAGNLIKTRPYGNPGLLQSREVDAFGRVVKEINGRGFATLTEYDRLGRVISIKEPAGSEGQRSQWDAFGRVLSRTDALGNTTSYSYDRKKRSLRVQTAEGVIQTTTYNQFGQQIKIEDGNGFATSYHYDKAGRLLEVVDPYARRLRNNWDEKGSGLLITVEDGRRQITSFEYDAARRELTKTIDPDGLKLTTRHVLDAFGRTIRETDARGIHTDTVFDKNGRIKSITVDPHRPQDNYQGLHLQTQYTWDGRNQKLTEVDPAGVVTTYQNSENGISRVTVLDPDGLNLRSETMVDATGQNIIVRLSGISGSGGIGDSLQSTRYAYDENNRLRYEVDSMGSVVSYSYDNNNRLIKQTRHAIPIALPVGADGKPDWRKALSMGDIARALVSNPQADSTERKVYDKDGRLAGKIDAQGGITTYSYDQNSRIQSERQYAKALPSQALNTLPAKLDSAALQNLISTQKLTDAARDCQQRYLYDGRGQMTTILRAAGLNAQGVQQWAVQAQYYDGEGLVIETRGLAALLTHAAPTAAEIYPFISANAAKPIEQTAADQITRYVYDAAKRQIASAQATGIVRDGSYVFRHWAVRHLRYDQAGHVTQDIRYAAQLRRNNAQSPNDGDIAGFYDPYPQNNQVTHKQYDAAGRVTLQAVRLDRVGSTKNSWAVTRHSYDAHGQVLASTAYANPVETDAAMSQAALDSIATNLTSNPVHDRQIRYAYDKAQRQVVKVDPMGYVTRNQYSAQGDLVQSTQYANALRDFNQNITPDTVPDVTRDDRSTLRFYDREHRLRYQVDSLGYVSETRYDALGQISASVRHAPALPLKKSGQSNGIDAASSLQEIASLISANTNTAARQQRYVYDAKGQVRYEIDALGYLTAFSYDGLGNRTSQSRYQQALSLKPDASSAELASAIAAAVQAQDRLPATRRESWQYNSLGLVESHLDALANRESFTYDAFGNKASWTNQLDATWTYSYDAANRLQTSRSPQVAVYSSGNINDQAQGDWELGRTPVMRTIDTVHEYDAFGNLTRKIEAAGIHAQEKIERFTYDLNNRQISSQLDNSSLGFNHRVLESTSNPELRTHHGAGTIEQPVSTSRYNAFGDVIERKDGARNISYQLYDQLGRLTYSISPYTEMYQYNRATDYVSHGTYQNAVTAYAYDGFGQVTQKTSFGEGLSGLSSSSSAEDVQNKLLQMLPALQTHAQNRHLWMNYDALGRQTGTREDAIWLYDQTSTTGNYLLQAARYHATRYNEFGEVAASLHYAVDAQGQRVTAASGQYHYYDARGQQIAKIDLLAETGDTGYLTTWKRDAAGQKIAQTEYANAINGFTQAAYRLPTNAEQDPARDRTTEWEYDAANRQTAEIRVNALYVDAGGNSVRGNLRSLREYDKAGNHVASIDAIGTRSTNFYDAANRVTATLHTAANGLNPYTEFRLDARGNTVLKVEYAQGARWDGSRWLPIVSNPDSANGDHITAMNYDSAGFLVEVIDGAKGKMNYHYDELGRKVLEWRVYSLVDAQGNLSTNKSSSYTYYEYDDLGRLSRIASPSNGNEIGGNGQSIYHANRYNLFNEVIWRGLHQTADTSQDYTMYDQSGHSWLTSSGDGVDKITLYNAQGLKTAEYVSLDPDPNQAHVLRGKNSVQEALASPNLQLRSTRYNLLGQVIDQRSDGSGQPRVLQRNSLGVWQAVPSNASNSANAAGSLLIVGQQQGQSAIRANLRKVGQSTWQDASAQIQISKSVNGDAYTLSREGLAGGEYEYQIVRANGEDDDILLASGKLNVPNVPGGDGRTDAYRATMGAQIIQLYNLVFARAPDKNGLEWWLNATRQVGMLDIVAGMLSSDEGKQKFSGDVSTLVARIFSFSFGRTGEAQDTAYAQDKARWVTRLTQASAQDNRARAQVVLDLLDSVEAYGSSSQASDNDAYHLGAKLRLRACTDAVARYLLDGNGDSEATANAILHIATRDPVGVLVEAERQSRVPVYDKPLRIAYRPHLKGEYVYVKLSDLANLNPPAPIIATMVGDRFKIAANPAYPATQADGSPSPREYDYLLEGGDLDAQTGKWSNLSLLSSGTVSFAKRANNTEDKRSQYAIQIAHLYNILVNRAPDSSGLQYWLNQVREHSLIDAQGNPDSSGSSNNLPAVLQQLAQTLLQDQECQSYLGSDAYAAMRKIFANAFGRPRAGGDASYDMEVTEWGRRLAANADPAARAQVINALLTDVHSVNNVNPGKTHAAIHLNNRAASLVYYLHTLQGTDNRDTQALFSLSFDNPDAAMLEAERRAQESALALNLQYRLKGSATWQDGAGRVRIVGGYSVFDTNGLSAGEYEYRSTALNPAKTIASSGTLRVTNTQGTGDIGNTAGTATLAPAINIIQLFDLALARPPQLRELNWMLQRYKHGDSLQVLLRDLLNSTEGKQRFAGQDNRAQIATLLRDAMGRSQPQEGVQSDKYYASDVQAWAERLQSADLEGDASRADSRAQVLLDLLQTTLAQASNNVVSLAAKTRLNNRATAVAHYLHDFHGGSESTTNAIYQKATTDLTGALRDAETLGVTDLQNYQISQLSQAILGRAPNSTELNQWRTLLSSSNLEALAQQLFTLAPGMPQDVNQANYAQETVKAVLLVALKRVPSAAEINTWAVLFPTHQANGDNSAKAAWRGKFALSLIVDISNYNGSNTQRQQDAQNFAARVGQTANLTETIFAQNLQVQQRMGPERYTVDRWGNLLSSTDMVDPTRITRYTYDDQNRRLSEESPEIETMQVMADGSLQTRKQSITQRKGYDARGLEVVNVDGNGNMNRMQYNAFGQLQKEIRADQTSTTYTLDALGQRLQSTVQLEAGQQTTQTTYYAYNGRGQLVDKYTAPVTVYGTSDGINATAYANASIHDVYRYDEAGRQVAVGNYSTHNYAITWSRLSEYNRNGSLYKVTDALGNSTRYTYDHFGQKIVEVDAQGGKLTWTYDAWGRVLKHSDLSARETIYNYDAKGLLRKEEWRAGSFNFSVRNYDYDTDGNRSGLYEISGQGNQEVNSVTIGNIAEYVYNKNGQRISEKLKYGIEVIQNQRLRYNALGWLTDVRANVFAGGFQLHYDYDANGNRVQLTNQWADPRDIDKNRIVQMRYGFDAMNRQISAQGFSLKLDRVGGSDGGGDKPSPTEPPERLVNDGLPYILDRIDERVTYNGAGQRTSLQQNNLDGKTSRQELRNEIYTYDAAGRLSLIKEGENITGERRYDSAGRIVEAINGALSQVSVYDQAGRVLSVAQKGAGATQHNSKTLYDSYDKLNHLLAYRNLAANDDTISSVRITYAEAARYDTWQQSQITTTNKDGVQTTSTMAYNAWGRLVQTDVAGKTPQKRQYITDSNGVILRTKHTVKGLEIETHNLVAAGASLGSGDTFSDTFSAGFDSLSGSTASAESNTYTTQSGSETLPSIAQAIWGDAGLWYVLGDANALQYDAQLKAGTCLVIPPRPNTTINNAHSVRPYDPSHFTGDLTPAPAPLAQPEGPCALAQFLTAAVSIAASTVFGPIGGNLAGQLMGNLTGVQHGFNWKSFAQSVIMQGLDATGTIPKANTSLPQGMENAGVNWVDQVSNAMVRNVASQAVGMAVGAQKGFSWHSLALAGVGPAMDKFVDDQFGGFFQESLGVTDSVTGQSVGGFSGVAQSLLSNTMSGIVAAPFAKGGFDMGQLLTDALGQSVGQSWGQSLKGWIQKDKEYGTAYGGSHVGSIKPTQDNRALLNSVNQKADPDYYKPPMPDQTDVETAHLNRYRNDNLLHADAKAPPGRDKRPPTAAEVEKERRKIVYDIIDGVQGRKGVDFTKEFRESKAFRNGHIKVIQDEKTLTLTGDVHIIGNNTGVAPMTNADIEFFKQRTNASWGTPDQVYRENGVTYRIAPLKFSLAKSYSEADISVGWANLPEQRSIANPATGDIWMQSGEKYKASYAHNFTMGHEFGHGFWGLGDAYFSIVMPNGFKTGELPAYGYEKYIMANSETGTFGGKHIKTLVLKFLAMQNEQIQVNKGKNK